MRIRVFLPLLIAASLSGCSGGGSSSLPATQVAAVPSATSAPSVVPTSAPGAVATATPVATAANHIAAAPAQVFTSSGVRKPLSVNLGAGGVPQVIVGYNPTMGGTFSQLYAWAVTSLSQPVKETSLTIVPQGPLSIQAVVQDNQNAFSLTNFDWIVNPGSLSGTGKINLNATFGDGTIGVITYYSYDKWNLTCGVSSPGSPGSWAYQGGIPVGQVLPQDVILDCVHHAIQFPNGASLLKSPVADTYGNLASQMTSVLAGSLGVAITSIPLTQIQVGEIYYVLLSDGGHAKFMLVQNDLTATPTIFGFSLEDSPRGSGNFAF